MTPELFIEVGEALYGAHWREQMAAALGVNRRTLHRWSSGANAIPDRVTGLLLDMVGRKAALLSGLYDCLDAAWLDIQQSPRYAPTPQKEKGPQA